MVSRRQDGCVYGLLPIERRSEFGARQKSFSRNAVSEPLHALPGIGSAVRRFDEERGFSVPQGVFHLGVTGNGRAGPAGQADKGLGRSDQHRLHRLDKVLAHRDFLLRSPRKCPLLAGFGKRITARRHPQTAAREFFGQIRDHRVIRSDDEPDHARRVNTFTGGDAAPQTAARTIVLG